MEKVASAVASHPTVWPRKSSAPRTTRPSGEPPDSALVRALPLTESQRNGCPGTLGRIISTWSLFRQYVQPLHHWISWHPSPQGRCRSPTESARSPALDERQPVRS